MPRVLAVACLFLSGSFGLAQNASSSDPVAVSLAQKSVAALTGGMVINDVTLNSNVISILGSDNKTGTGTFKAKGASESRVDLRLSGGTLSEVRNLHSNGPAGAWSKNGNTAVPQAQHNVLTDASWFFPALASLAQYGGSSYVFKYIGQEQHNGVNAQHVQVALVPPTWDTSVQRLSTTDCYFDPVSFLPLAIDFKVHADKDMNVNIPVEILFANYQSVNGVQVPFHIQRMLDGGVVLDITVISATFNTGIPDSSFTLQ